jgi:hypothetical protein
MIYPVTKESHPTQHAPEGWESPRFQAVCVAQASSVKAVLSRPAHPRVTQTVGPLKNQGNTPKPNIL